MRQITCGILSLLLWSVTPAVKAQVVGSVQDALNDYTTDPVVNNHSFEIESVDYSRDPITNTLKMTVTTDMPLQGVQNIDWGSMLIRSESGDRVGVNFTPNESPLDLGVYANPSYVDVSGNNYGQNHFPNVLNGGDLIGEASAVQVGPNQFEITVDISSLSAQEALEVFLTMECNNDSFKFEIPGLAGGELPPDLGAWGQSDPGGSGTDSSRSSGGSSSSAKGGGKGGGSTWIFALLGVAAILLIILLLLGGGGSDDDAKDAKELKLSKTPNNPNNPMGDDAPIPDTPITDTPVSPGDVPTNPFNPVVPSQPDSPNKPSNPTGPTNPGKPTTPNKPNEPKKVPEPGPVAGLALMFLLGLSLKIRGRKIEAK